jgi:CheY-like chemotaxis protein
MDWVKDADKVTLILWLYGPAGAGKSAIAQTIAELLEEAGLLAAAFFFSRNAAGRDDKTPLVATLVYQLIISIPEIRAHVLEALEQDPALFSRSIQAQIQALIVKPLNAVATDETFALILLSRPRLIILDGLDECRTTLSQTHILNALSRAIKHLHIPLCFLIASRPEQDIRQAFNDQNHGLGSISFSIALDDTYRPDRDIEVFLQSTFDEIKRNHPSRAHLPTSWPSSEDICRLVKKSSGQFIFASTVAKYVNSNRHWPPDRLKVIFGQSEPGWETPFAELDSLYHLILSSVADIEKVKDVLMILVLQPLQANPYTRGRMTALIKDFLFYRHGELDMILTDLHSIICVPPPGDEFSQLRFFHASLPDFLLDRSRSMDLFLDQGAAYAKITGLTVQHINNPTESPLRNDPCMLSHSCCDFIDSMKMKF